MRIAFPRSQRTQSCIRARLALRICLYPRYPRRNNFVQGDAASQSRQFTSTRHLAKSQEHVNTRIHPPQRQVGDRRKSTRKTSRSATIVEGEAPSPDINLVPHQLHEKRRNVNTWIRLLEKYLPVDLRQRAARGDEHVSADTATDCRNILAILQAARKKSNAETDILAYLITSPRRKAGLWLCKYLLKHLHTSSSARTSDRPPSNIVWPENSLKQMTKSSIDVTTILYDSFENSSDWNITTIDPRYSSVFSDAKDKTMDQIWTTLGTIVVQSTGMDKESAHNAMNAVQLVLGQLHNLDLVPDNVYSYQASTLSATVQRPPIIHLVSSRILTALSDAAWREQQEENIEKAASLGLSYQEIGRDPPGGRFRLKVSPMGPEVWLEFILWCCVEGGFATAGARIINLLQRDTKDPWFSISWSNNANLGHVAPHIDWERVRSRTGGTVGRIEGYSKVKPLADVPDRTVSTEVVLALVEANLDLVRRTPTGNGLNLEVAQYSIVNLISFLEPHNLPKFFFDYLSSRLVQTGVFDVNGRWKALGKWYNRLSLLRSLNPVEKSPLAQISFALDAVLMHSEYTAGLLQQVLDSHIQEGNIHDALKAFNDLQMLVDDSKLHSIGAFLQQTPNSDEVDDRSEDSSSPSLLTGNPDFVTSHGQLPTYKLAGVLDLATDSQLIGLGQWLIYNDDPDGALIPRSTYGNAGIARSIIRFAAMSNDVKLLRLVLAAASRKRLPTVNFLRAKLDAYLALLDMSGIRKVLDDLSRAQGGGYGLLNLANVATTILRLEKDATSLGVDSKENTLRSVEYLFSMMLTGQVEGPSGIYQQGIRTKFRQQVSHLLTIFKRFPGSAIASIAEANQNRFRPSNIPNLAPTVFNAVLEAVLDTQGAKEGAILVDTLCTDTASQLTKEFDEGEVDEIDVDMYTDEGSTFERETDVMPSGIGNQEQASLPSTTVISSPSFVQTQRPASHTADTKQDFVPFVCPESENEHFSSTRQSFDEPADEPSERSSVGKTNLTDESLGVDQEEIPFVSPYFSQSLQAQQPIEQEDLSDDAIEPVCLYNARTIRLVVQKALRELRDRSEAGLSASQQRSILKWARRKLQRINCSPETIQNEVREPTRVEIEQPLADSQAGNSTTARHRELSREKSGFITKSRNSARISKTFRGTRVLTFDPERQG